MSRSTTRQITKFDSGLLHQVQDALVVEEPVEFRLDGVPIAVLMRSPGDDESLARGFVLSESILLHPDEFVAIEPSHSANDDARWDIILRPDVVVDAEQFRRNTYTTSSCGVCGKASIDAVRIAAPPVAPGPAITATVVSQLPESMRRRQAAFEITGGLHAAAAFKLIGDLASRHWPLAEFLLMVSGRISFEIVQKAAVVGIPVVCGVSAASSLAVELGDELGMTVIGFVRNGAFNVYCGSSRVRST